MLDFIDPPSLVAWAIAALSASLYPLGLILGSSCSSCCNPPCASPPFNRCMRDECITCTPPTGTSTRILSTADAFPPAHIPTNISGPTQTAEYLAGDRCLEYQSNGQTYRRCIEPQNVLCGIALCDRPWLLPQTVTATKPGPCSQTITAIGRLGFGFGACRFFGTTAYCEDKLTIEESPGFVGLPASAFFKGDLLYALENGPYRNTVTIGSVTVSLGGTPTLTDGGATGVYYCNQNINPVATISGVCISNVAITGNSLSRGDLISQTGDTTGLDTVADSYCSYQYTDSLSSNTFVGCGSLRKTLAGGSPFLSISAGVSVAACGGGQTLTSEISKSQTLTDGAFTTQVSISVSGSDSVSGHVQVSKTRVVGFVQETVGSAKWAVSGSVSINPTFGTASMSGARIASISPTSLPWNGGNVSAEFINWNGSGSTVQTAFQPRSDAIQGSAAISFQTGNFPGSPYFTDGPSAIASVTQAYKPCGIVGFASLWNGGSQTSSTSHSANYGKNTGLITPLFEQSTPCDPEYDAAATEPWITIVRVADSESVCVTIESNTTGSPRQGEVQFSPTWMLSGQPSTSGSATHGTFGYVITQSA